MAFGVGERERELAPLWKPGSRHLKPVAGQRGRGSHLVLASGLRSSSGLVEPTRSQPAGWAWIEKLERRGSADPTVSVPFRQGHQQAANIPSFRRCTIDSGSAWCSPT